MLIVVFLVVALDASRSAVVWVPGRLPIQQQNEMLFKTNQAMRGNASLVSCGIQPWPGIFSSHRILQSLKPGALPIRHCVQPTMSL